MASLEKRKVMSSESKKSFEKYHVPTFRGLRDNGHAIIVRNPIFSPEDASFPAEFSPAKTNRAKSNLLLSALLTP